jgi:hypothetical protein
MDWLRLPGENAARRLQWVRWLRQTLGLERGGKQSGVGWRGAVRTAGVARDDGGCLRRVVLRPRHGLQVEEEDCQVGPGANG